MFPAVMTRERREWLDLPPEERAAVPEPRLRIFAGIDDKTRFIRMSDVGLTPVNADVVRSCMADAVRGETIDGTFVGGIVRKWRWDNALEQLARKVADAAERLGAEQVAPVMPYAGWMKGKIERHWRTQQDEFWSRQPGWYGEDESPFVTSLAADQLKTCGELAAEYDGWEESYNRTRVHSVTRMTPLDAWRASVTAIVMPPDEAFALAYEAHGRDGRGPQARRPVQWLPVRGPQAWRHRRNQGSCRLQPPVLRRRLRAPRRRVLLHGKGHGLHDRRRTACDLQPRGGRHPAGHPDPPGGGRRDGGRAQSVG